MQEASGQGHRGRGGAHRAHGLIARREHDRLLCTDEPFRGRTEFSLMHVGQIPASSRIVHPNLSEPLAQRDGECSVPEKGYLTPASLSRKPERTRICP